MYISKVTLTNIRGFERLEFDLDRGGGTFAGWTVFTGDNGSGKSALLKAIAIGLVGPQMARALQPSFRGWVREGCEEASIILEINPVRYEDGYIGVGEEYVWRDKPFPVDISITDKDMIKSKSITDNPLSMLNLPIWFGGSPGWFSCGYGPFRRMFGASPEAMKQMVIPTAERFATMFHEAASLSEVDQWLRDEKLRAMERGVKSETLDQLLNILNDGLLPQGMAVDRVDADGLWIKDANGVELSWRDMSDGTRAVIALIADILRHLIKGYWDHDERDDEFIIKRNNKGNLVIQRSGVVLIDEIDAHLHPEWQRKIGFWLKARFPYIQFLVTSHSPLICQAADPNGIFVLPEPGNPDPPRALTAEEYLKVIASRPDTILLSPAFGLQNTRSPRVVEARKEWSDIKAIQRSGFPLNGEEEMRLSQLAPLVRTDEEL